jgi:hypothetical protein
MQFLERALGGFLDPYSLPSLVNQDKGPAALSRDIFPVYCFSERIMLNFWRGLEV